MRQIYIKSKNERLFYSLSALRGLLHFLQAQLSLGDASVASNLRVLLYIALSEAKGRNRLS
jgi:hypothetical protein